MLMPRCRALFCLALCLLLPAQAALAGGGDHGREQDRARAALQAGAVIPYAAVQERVRRACDCEVLESKLHEEDGGWLYEIKALSAAGQIVKLKLDAHNGDVLSMKGKGYKH